MTKRHLFLSFLLTLFLKWSLESITLFTSLFRFNSKFLIVVIFLFFDVKLYFFTILELSVHFQFSAFFAVFQPVFTVLLSGCRPTSQRLGAGGAFTAARTGAKLPNPHKLSGETLPRLRQTARCAFGISLSVYFSLCTS